MKVTFLYITKLLSLANTVNFGKFLQEKHAEINIYPISHPIARFKAAATPVTIQVLKGRQLSYSVSTGEWF